MKQVVALSVFSVRLVVRHHVKELISVDLCLAYPGTIQGTKPFENLLYSTSTAYPSHAMQVADVLLDFLPDSATRFQINEVLAQRLPQQDDVFEKCLVATLFPQIYREEHRHRKHLNGRKGLNFVQVLVRIGERIGIQLN